MDEGLDRLEDIMKSCQLSGTDPKNQPLQRQFGLICRVCGVNGHIMSECSCSSYGNLSWGNQRFNYNFKNNFPNEGTPISTLSVRKGVMEWEPIHSNPEFSSRNFP